MICDLQRSCTPWVGNYCYGESCLIPRQAFFVREMIVTTLYCEMGTEKCFGKVLREDSTWSFLLIEKWMKCILSQILLQSDSIIKMEVVEVRLLLFLSAGILTAGPLNETRIIWFCFSVSTHNHLRRTPEDLPCITFFLRFLLLAFWWQYSCFSTFLCESMFLPFTLIRFYRSQGIPNWH